MCSFGRLKVPQLKVFLTLYIVISEHALYLNLVGARTDFLTLCD